MTLRMAMIGVDHPHALGYRETLALIPEVELVGVYDEEPQRARLLLQGGFQDVAAFYDGDPQGCSGIDYAALPVHGDLDALLSELHPDAVLICLPNDVTPEAIVRCAEAGCHIYAEKPCARTAREFAPAAEAVTKAGVAFETGYIKRMQPIARAIKDAVDQGLMGRLLSVETRWVTTSVAMRDPGHFLFSRKRSGGGILHWLGCHWLDLMRWVASSEVVSVSGELATMSGEGIDVEDIAALTLRHENDMVGSLHCAYATDAARDKVYFGLRGTRGWAEWERNGNALTLHSTDPSWSAAPTRVIDFQRETVPGYCGADGLAALKAFVARVLDGTPGYSSPDDVAQVLRILDAAKLSSKSGRRVDL
jgi:predicted dehydrogenase